MVIKAYVGFILEAMMKFGFCLWLICFLPGLNAQPSVGLVNTDIEGQLGVGKKIMQIADSINNSVADSINDNPTPVFSNQKEEKINPKNSCLVANFISYLRELTCPMNLRLLMILLL